MSYDTVIGGKSIYAVYCAETQIITRIDAAHSCFVFASAKLSKITGFCKYYARKKVNGEFAFAVI